MPDLRYRYNEFQVLNERILMTSDDSLGSVSLIFQQLQDGDRDAARKLWTRYFPRLAHLAQTVLRGRRLPSSAEDAVQDAFLQFFQHAEFGNYHRKLHRDRIWQILSRITIQRASKLIRREAAQKRGSGGVMVASDLEDGSCANVLDNVIGTLSTAEFDVILKETLELLDDDLREIVFLRLAGYTNAQMKDMLGCSLRSVERRLFLIRATWSA